MDRKILDRQFDEALSAKEPSSKFGLIMASLIGAATFFVGALCVLVGIVGMSNDANAAEATLAVATLIGGLTILCQSVMVSMLVVLVKDNRDTKRLVKRVAAGIVKRPSTTK
jgi:hypothetical protein